jgi:flagellar basal body-associated protein FliL
MKNTIKVTIVIAIVVVAVASIAGYYSITTAVREKHEQHKEGCRQMFVDLWQNRSSTDDSIKTKGDEYYSNCVVLQTGE